MSRVLILQIYNVESVNSGFIVYMYIDVFLAGLYTPQLTPVVSALLFSATFRKRVEKLARDILIDPVRVVQGEAGEVISLYFLTCTVKGTLLFCNLLWVRVMVFNTTFNNISVILWRSVLLVEETGVPGENHRPAASH